MKAIFFAIVGLLLPLHLFSQLHDNTWVLGYPGFGDIYGHSILTFSDGSLQIDSSSVMKDIDFPQNNSAFSHEDGELFAFGKNLASLKDDRISIKSMNQVLEHVH
ncbi:MAG: hypothetical protein KIS77_21580 [Saprospiraceae bacterium]|nr:hypothetical protein [Saprospiraceae bacterium]